MKRMLSLVPCIAALVFFAGVIPATAGTLSQVSFGEGPVYTFPAATGVDAMKVFIDTPGVVFSSPGLTVYDASVPCCLVGASGWTTDIWSPTYAAASGPSLPALFYDLSFDIDNAMWPVNATIGVDVYYFQNGTLIDSAGLHYTGPTQFDTSVNTWNPDNQWPLVNQGGLAGEDQTTPEPTTIILMGSALIGIAVRRRYCKR